MKDDTKSLQEAVITILRYLNSKEGFSKWVDDNTSDPELYKLRKKQS